ncbi:MAG: hypothetical protein WAR37_04595 [Candidatus Microsaccharimonas sp.]
MAITLSMLQQKFHALQEEMKGLAKWVGVVVPFMNKQFKNIDTRFDKIEAKIDRIELSVTTNADLLLATKTDLEIVKKSMITKKDLKQFATKTISNSFNLSSLLSLTCIIISNESITCIRNNALGGECAANRAGRCGKDICFEPIY